MNKPKAPVVDIKKNAKPEKPKKVSNVKIEVAMPDAVRKALEEQGVDVEARIRSIAADVEADAEGLTERLDGLSELSCRLLGEMLEQYTHQCARITGNSSEAKQILTGEVANFIAHLIHHCAEDAQAGMCSVHDDDKSMMELYDTVTTSVGAVTRSKIDKTLERLRAQNEKGLTNHVH